jgi:hypothetical protein
MRLFLYLLALLTGLSVADANPSARAAPVAVDTIFVAQRNAANPARQRSSVPSRAAGQWRTLDDLLPEAFAWCAKAPSARWASAISMCR